MAEFFELGDKVVLNSGGPVMVIEEILPENEQLYCVWITEEGKKNGGYFKRPTISLLVREETE